MAQEKIRDRRSQKRERVAVSVLLLFPVLVAVGFATPGWVRMVAVAQTSELVPRDPVRDRVGSYGRRPLSARRDLFVGSTAALIDLDDFFAAADYEPRLTANHLAQPLTMTEQLARVAAFKSDVSAFDRSYGDWIAAGHVGNPPVDPAVVFKDLVQAEVKASSVWASDGPMTLLGLCGTLHGTNCVTDDDLTNVSFSVPMQVPEPSTAILVALGLLGMAVARRRAA